MIAPNLYFLFSPFLQYSFRFHDINPLTLISIVGFFSSNKEISGKGPRPVRCVLLEQAMSPIYLSSSGGIDSAYLLQFHEKKITSVLIILISLSSLKALCDFFLNLHILQYRAVARVDSFELLSS